MLQSKQGKSSRDDFQNLVATSFSKNTSRKNFQEDAISFCRGMSQTMKNGLSHNSEKSF